MSPPRKQVPASEPKSAEAAVEAPMEAAGPDAPAPDAGAAAETVETATEAVDTAAGSTAEALGAQAEAAVETGTEAAAQSVEAGASAAASVGEAAEAAAGAQQETADAARMFESLTRVQREMAEFVSARIRQDMETQQAFLRCRTLDEVRSVQTEFFRTAMDQYAAEATKLMRLGSEMMAKTVERRDG